MALTGCLERELKPLNPCLVSGVVAEVKVANVDKVDLLFMVDDSISMQDEQTALSREFPRLIQALATGDRDLNGEPDFTAVKDLHIGVVSSDMGIPGLNLPMSGCTDRGDDGILQSKSQSTETGCSVPMFNPPYLMFDKARGDDPLQLATNFTCIAKLGTSGCGFEQQLESAFKAVWPGNDPKWVFAGLGGTTPGNAGPGFPNGDFIRENSLIAIVLVTDEEDCSSRQFGHFDPNDTSTGLNTRCFREGQKPDNNLFSVERYIQGFKDLRPDQENLVIFAGIVGVPERLVTAEAMKGIDFKKPEQSNAFFDGLLADPEMQERILEGDPARVDDDNLVPSCRRPTTIVDDKGNVVETESKAYPPRRIVQVAKGFGANGVIQSICQDDFGPAMNAIIEVIANQIGNVCLPRALVRNSDDLVDCNVIWELPKEPISGTPTRCDERPFLSPPDADRASTGKNMGAACKVAQLPVENMTEPMGADGWYYDDFSPKTIEECMNQPTPQRITFTTGAMPPTGVTVKLECLNETQSLANTRTDLAPEVEQPAVGSPCEEVMLRNQLVSGDDACMVLLAQPVNGSVEDRRMFCHLESQVCVQRCATDAECPASWVCDDRADSIVAAGQPYCVNPTCGGQE